MNFIDSHCHFDFQDFDQDRRVIWGECQNLGIHQLLIPGVEPKQWQKASTLCDDYSGFVYSAGLHPWWIKESKLSPQALIDALIKEADNPRCIAIGECGLDGTMDLQLEQQQCLFEAQISVAQALRMPLVVHSVKTHAFILQSLKKFKLPAGGVIHGFSGSYEQALQFWQLGFYLGIGGTITYPRANKTRDAATRLPLAALLLESDAPDMPLNGHQGARNRPDRIIDIAKTLAELRHEPLNQIAEQTCANFSNLFQIKKPAGA